MGKTAIGWTDETWNPVRGCSRVSEGCRHCYAEEQAARIVRMGKGKPTAYDGLVSVRSMVSGLRYTSVNAAGSYDEPRWTGVVRLVPERLADPLRWRAPRRVFVNSMSDLFHESLANEQIAAVFGVMAAAPQHTFQVLTKRARRMREWFEWVAGYGRAVCLVEAESHGMRMPDDLAWPLPNVWLGVSVENQDAADERIPLLLDTPAVVRFISAEPLLGSINLTLHGSRVADWDEDLKYDVLRGLTWTSPREWAEETPPARGKEPRVDWVIDGCESGGVARPAQREWFASLEAQCRAAGVAYFHKQEVVDGRLVHDFPGRQEFPR